LLLLAGIVLANNLARGFNLHATSTCSAHPVQTRCCTMGTNSFRTEVHIPLWPEHTQLGYEDSFFLLGSCFSDNIGGRLFRAKLRASVNPSHGLLFSPLSAAASLDRMVSGVPYEENEAGLIFSEGKGLWNSLDHHSSFSSTSRRECVSGMNAALAKGREDLLSATCIFVTLGTAWVFRHRESGKDVANCHKIPAYNFDRRIVSVDEIAQALHRSLSNVLRVNPAARVLLTVSPVRHWRDGPVENGRSKSHLLAGAHAAIELLRAAGQGEGVGEGGPGRVSYFPSFEIVNDDLRDYRFYEPDMIHPNSVAVDYIWDKLVGAMFSDDAVRTMQEVEKIVQGTEHRPFNPKSDAHQSFLRKQLAKLENLERRYPRLKLDDERGFFNAQLLEPATASFGH
ncbi:unnamed protein product, partial [Hapterophycus canaliculatus]